jgi:predicted alpha/beta superfamily hydrolase
MRSFINGIKGAVMFCVLIVSCPSKNWAQTDVVIGKEFTLRSDILKEVRSYFVRLPASYENDEFYANKRYPVLVLLDADTHFFPVSGLIHSLSVNDEQIPEMIVVGIRNINRSRDLTPDEASDNHVKFMRFIEHELLKEIDNRYRTLSFRLLAGHSLAGLFALNSFLDQDSFNAYIAIDPSLNFADQAVNKKAETVLRQPENKFHFVVYIAQSVNPFHNKEKVDRKKEVFAQFENYLKSNASKDLSYQCDFFENEDHFSIPSISFYRGLLFVFDGFKISLKTLANKTTEDILQHYKMFHERMGAAIPPPGKLIDQIGLFFLKEKMSDQAINVLKANEVYYPNSFITYQSLGDAFKEKGNKEVAIQYYKKSLTLNPANDKARKLIEELVR